MPVSQNITNLFEDKARKGDGAFAIAYALMEVAAEQRSLAYQVRQLGFGDAATSMGAIEGLTKVLSENGDAIARALQSIADRE